jgi:plasmid stabilization system protein ParE
MKKYKIEYLPIALNDIKKSVNYIKDVLNSNQGAKGVTAELDKKVKVIESNPFIYPEFLTENELLKNTRFAVVKNYLLFYKIFDERIEVRRFIYKKKDIR